MMVTLKRSLTLQPILRYEGRLALLYYIKAEIYFEMPTYMNS